MKRVVITKKEKELAKKFIESLNLMAADLPNYSKAEIIEGLLMYSSFLKDKFKITD
jgi:hypothetical protein